jgi:hypothetical protein
MTTATANPIAMTQAADTATCTIVRICHRVRPVTRAPAMARIDPPSGAMTMAPMIDATESWKSPKAATNPARVSRTQ